MPSGSSPMASSRFACSLRLRPASIRMRAESVFTNVAFPLLPLPSTDINTAMTRHYRELHGQLRGSVSRGTPMRIITSCGAALLLPVSTAWAQAPTHSLPDLAQRLQKGDRVRVTAKDGTITSGRFDSVSDSSLRLNGSGRTPRDVPADTISQVSKKRPESAWNGVLIGLAVGVGSGLVATSAVCGSNDSECSAIAALAFIPAFSGGGAAIGAIVDRMYSKYDPVYLQQTSLERRRLYVVPVVSKDVKGIQVSLS